MDRPAAALAIAIGLFLILVWKQIVGAAEISPNKDIRLIVLIGSVIVGLTVYINANASR